MDWLTGLPVIGPVVAWVLRTRPYRVYEHFNAANGNRLAGAMTFFGFLALFPLLTLAAAVAAAVLNQSQVHRLQGQVTKQLPGLTNSLDLNNFVANAGTVGVISGVVLLFSGLGLVSTMRGSIRAVWDLPEDPGNPIIRKLLDVGVLIGLGIVAAISIGASLIGGFLAGRIATAVGLERTGAGHYVLAVAGFVVAVIADMFMFVYLLAGLPRLGEEFESRPRRRVLLQGALLGAIGFELLKLLLSSYLSRVAGRSMYGAFGTPVALLLWINFISRWLFFCVSWTAASDPVAVRARLRARARNEIAELDEKYPQDAAEEHKAAGEQAAGQQEAGERAAEEQEAGEQAAAHRGDRSGGRPEGRPEGGAQKA